MGVQCASLYIHFSSRAKCERYDSETLPQYPSISRRRVARGSLRNQPSSSHRAREQEYVPRLSIVPHPSCGANR